MQYDLASTQDRPHHPVAERRGARRTRNIQFSPDGKLMYLFSDQDVLIYDTTTFTQVDKWELSKPIEEGFGRLEFGSTRRRSTTSPVLHGDVQRVRSGAAPADDGHRPRQPRREDGRLLHARSGHAGRASRWRQAARSAYGLFQDIGRYEFWKFDLEQPQAGRRGPSSQGRPRMSLKTSSNGKVLYIYNAGNTIDLYDAETYQYLQHDHARRRHDHRSVRASARRQRRRAEVRPQ